MDRDEQESLPFCSTEGAPRMIAVGGGKGGVGKTFFVVNLAVALARLGHEVILVDADLDGANLHTVLGVGSPATSLADFIAYREKDLAKLVLDTTIPRLRFIAATHANLASAQPGHFQRVRFLKDLRKLHADVILLDLGAGMQPALMDYFLAADDGVIVMTPEPTSIENAYGFLRAAFYRCIRSAVSSETIRTLVTDAMDQRNDLGIRTPYDLLREIVAKEPQEAERIEEAQQAFRPRIVVNHVQSAEEVRLGFAVRSACQKYFGIEAEYLGYINEDPAVRKAVTAGRPFVEAFPRSDAAVCIGRMARKIAAVLAEHAALAPAPSLPKVQIAENYESAE